jgi:hypothetical protein
MIPPVAIHRLVVVLLIAVGAVVAFARSGPPALATGKRIQRRIISCAQLGSKHMNVQEQIRKYITSQPESKRSDMRELHRLTLQVSPECKLWFFDGKDSKNHTVSNPTIGYGVHTIKYANGKSREFFQIGVSGNKTGISVYILGLKDKKYLAKTYGKQLGKASVTGYCIRFKALKDINIDTLEAAIRYGLAA